MNGMPPRPARPARPAGTQKEPSYQIGVPLDGSEDSALQPGMDRFDQDDTAQDHAAPPPQLHVSTEVSLPEDLAPADEIPEPAPPPPARPAAPRPSPPPTPGARSSASSRVASKSARSGRSSTRTGATSTSVPKVSSRRVSAVDRSGLLKALLWVGLGVLGAAVVITGIILLATHGSDDRRAGSEALAEAGRQYELAKTSLSNRRGADARKAYEAALKALTGTPQLGGAVATPPQEKPVVRDLAVRAFDLRSEVEKLNERIGETQEENAAQSHLAALKARFASLSDPVTDLDVLEKEILAYMENPVDPKAGASPAKAQTFSRLVSEAKLRLASIATERDRRTSETSAVPLRLAAVQVDGLVQQERFGEALAKLEEMAGKNSGADFAPLRAQVEDAAEKSWRSAKTKVDNHLADWKSPGATEGQRKAALVAAKDRLNKVIERFGIPTYVDQARTALTPLP